VRHDRQSGIPSRFRRRRLDRTIAAIRAVGLMN